MDEYDWSDDRLELLAYRILAGHGRIPEPILDLHGEILLAWQTAAFNIEQGRRNRRRRASRNYDISPQD